MAATSHDTHAQGPGFSRITQAICTAGIVQAAMNAPWWEKVTELDRQKASIYRDAALAHGIPHRPHGLFAADDKLLKEFNKVTQLQAWFLAGHR